MNETLKYKAYNGSVEYSAQDRVLHGKILGIRDMVTFEGADVNLLESNFQAAVDEYLQLCKEAGKVPPRPYSGAFNVRTGAALHRRAALYAEQHHLKLNSVVKQALEEHLERAGQVIPL